MYRQKLFSAKKTRQKWRKVNENYRVSVFLFFTALHCRSNWRQNLLDGRGCVFSLIFIMRHYLYGKYRNDHFCDPIIGSILRIFDWKTENKPPFFVVDYLLKNRICFLSILLKPFLLRLYIFLISVFTAFRVTTTHRLRSPVSWWLVGGPQ